MQTLLLSSVVVLLLAGCNVANTQAPSSNEDSDSGWNVGALVPDVTMRGSDGVDYRLRDLVGQKAFVIAWYPKSFTGG